MDEPRMPLRLVTYNIHHAEGTDGRIDPGRIADVLAETQADIIGLNEVHHPAVVKPGDPPLLAEIAAQLEMRYLFGTALPARADWRFPAPYGNALLSRYPLADAATYRLLAPEGRESRGMIAATLKIDQTWALRCYVTHLENREEEIRVRQLEQIEPLLALASDTPHLLMGDLNALSRHARVAQEQPQVVPTAVTARLEAVGYMDAQAAAGNAGQKTWNTTDPTVRIDYVWLAPALQETLVDCQAWVTPLSRVASDHYPVLTVLDLDRTSSL
jgi:endonuclease/exonuclease/phosphatase family metal-dependent hydrolase